MPRLAVSVMGFGRNRRYCRRCRNCAWLLMAVFGATASAQSSGGSYRIAPATVANGGGTLAGGMYHLSGTFGQIQTSRSAAPGYELYGGFWAPTSDVIFASGFDRQELP